MSERTRRADVGGLREIFRGEQRIYAASLLKWQWRCGDSCVSLAG